MIDDDAFLALMREAFGMEGYTVVTAPHPTDAFSLLRDTPPSLMILDLAFDRTRLAGLALLRTLRSENQFRALPVIVASAATGLLIAYKDEFTALNAATIAKPFDMSALMCLVGKMIPDATNERSYG